MADSLDTTKLSRRGMLGTGPAAAGDLSGISVGKDPMRVMPRPKARWAYVSQGLGRVPGDFGEAASWYRKAAEQGKILRTVLDIAMK